MSCLSRPVLIGSTGGLPCRSIWIEAIEQVVKGAPDAEGYNDGMTTEN
jgi:hypothetical protein